MLLLVMAITLLALPGTPIVPPGPAALLLPPKTAMPAPIGKLAMVLPSIVALVRLAALLPVPKVMM